MINILKNILDFKNLKIVIIVGVTLVVSVAFIGFLTAKARDRTISNLNKTISALKDKEAKLEEILRKLQAELQQAGMERESLQRRFDESMAELKKIEQERSLFKSKVASLEEERLRLEQKIDELTRMRQEAERALQDYKASVAKQLEAVKSQSQRQITAEPGSDMADVLKRNASLEIAIERLKQDISKKEFQVIESSRKIEALQETIDRMKDTKRQLEYSVTDAAQLAEALSVKLSREKKAGLTAKSRIKELEAEKMKLIRKIDHLSIAKSTLETTQQTGNDYTARSKTSSGAKDIVLPPIIVRPGHEKVLQDKIAGKIVEVYDEENFVIVDVGKLDGVSTGMRFEVYRNSNDIGLLEVIEARAAFSACDIKNKDSSLSEGDIVMSVK